MTPCLDLPVHARSSPPQTCVIAVAGCPLGVSTGGCSALLSTLRSGYKSYSRLGGCGNLGTRFPPSCRLVTSSLRRTLCTSLRSRGAEQEAWGRQERAAVPAPTCGRGGWYPPRAKRDQILMFAEGFETLSMVQSTNCFSHESRELLGQVVPGQLVVLALGWCTARVPGHVVCRGRLTERWAGAGPAHPIWLCAE